MNKVIIMFCCITTSTFPAEQQTTPAVVIPRILSQQEKAACNWFRQQRAILRKRAHKNSCPQGAALNDWWASLNNPDYEIGNPESKYILAQLGFIDAGALKVSENIRKIWENIQDEDFGRVV